MSARSSRVCFSRSSLVKDGLALKTSVLVKWPWAARLGQPCAVRVTGTQPGQSIWAAWLVSRKQRSQQLCLELGICRAS